MTRKKKSVPISKQLLQQFLPAFVIIWDELIFHVYINQKFQGNIWLIMLFSMTIGLTLTVITGRMKRTAANIVNWIVLGLISLLFMVQAVYQHLFKMYLTIFMTENAGDATQFYKTALAAIGRRSPLLLLILAPYVGYIIYTKKVQKHTRVRRSVELYSGLMAILAFVSALTILSGTKAVEDGRKELFYKQWEQDRGVQEFGLCVGFVQDVRKCLTYDEKDLGDVSHGAVPQVPTIVLKPTDTPIPEPSVTLPPEVTPTPTPTPIDTSPNVLDIDFAALAAASKNDNIRTIHEYMATSEPTKKNEYTGLCEGYNLIMMTCEAFSPFAVDEKLTPTLYKLVHSGLYFKNFYTPIWITSTSDGEYVACTGLIPDLKKNNSFRRSSDKSMALCFGHIFKSLGYSANAYHNNSYTYYGRDKSHPNMGYNWIAEGHGLKLTKQWPESDLEMMQATLPTYINDEHFHAYYMTVSGHMDYTWGGNAMSKKHKEEVADLPYCDADKAYIACNMELDLALEYILEELEKAGKLDKTLIVMSADHYPYGLENDQISEMLGHKVETEFELYENNCIIWSPIFTENPVTVEKYCCSLDIIPTVLNLMGIEYDSRLYMGSDIFSDTPGLVQFKDGSFITDYVRYNALKGKADWFNEEVAAQLTEEQKSEYIKAYKEIVKNKFNISRGILNNNYYSTLEPYLWWMKKK